MTTSVSSSTGASSLGSTSPKSIFGSNASTFLNMLTTQLKNQNPTSPMDTTAFTSQLVQFSQVEQLMNLSTSFKQVSGRMDDANFVQAMDLVGKNVKVQAHGLEVKNASADFAVHLDTPAVASSVSITDQSGMQVWYANGPTAAGDTPFHWDGKDMAGNQLPDGEYNVTVSTFGKDGKATEIAPIVETTVTGVARGANGTTLTTPAGIVSLSSLYGIVK
jgi:flagellar basal-body rod modification protein FlgD